MPEKHSHPILPPINPPKPEKQATPNEQPQQTPTQQTQAQQTPNEQTQQTPTLPKISTPRTFPVGKVINLILAVVLLIVFIIFLVLSIMNLRQGNNDVSDYNQLLENSQSTATSTTRT